MNFLLILPEELDSDRGEARISGVRAAAVRSEYELEVGIDLPAILLGDRRGRAEVLALQAEEIRLRVTLTDPAPVRPSTHLIVAVPRPQTIKKLLQHAATVGVSSVRFVCSAGVVKSYLQSKTLFPEKIQAEICKGLQQCGDPIAPEVHVHPHWQSFTGRILPEMIAEYTEPLLVLAATRAAGCQRVAGLPLLSAAQPVLVAIGPESGWSADEMQELMQIGFQPVTLGERIMRVETAAAYLLAQIDLLRDLAPGLE